MSSINGEWKIVKRKKRKITQSEEVRGPGAVRRHIVARANAPKSTKPGLPPPQSAAVSLTAPDGSVVTFAEAMLTVRIEIKRSELDIAKVGTRSAVTRAVILEIAGPKRGSEKASLLAERMAGVLRDTLDRIAVPQRMAELRIIKRSTERCSRSPQCFRRR